MTIAGLHALAPVLVTAPATTPVSLAEAKAHLRVTEADDDALIGSLVQAVTARLDGWSGILGRALVTQTWRQDYQEFPRGDVLRLPLHPVQSVTSVTYIDAAGATQTLSASLYRFAVDALGPAIVLDDDAVWPVTDERPAAVSVMFVCGTAPSQVPGAIKAAMLLMIGDLYRFTESAVSGSVGEVPMPVSVQALLEPYRRVGL